MKPTLKMINTSHTVSRPPLRIGITGGIGSGKSYICRQLEDAGHHVFYCDDVAKHIIRSHPIVKEELTQLVGKELYDAEGQLVKKVLASFLCKGKEYSHQVDTIVHPRVADAFKVFCQEHQAETSSSSNLLMPSDKCISLQSLKKLSPSHVVFMECALLFEAQFDKFVDLSVLVHVSSETQINRLIQRDHISREQAMRWIGLQLSENEKLTRADAYIVNE